MKTQTIIVLDREDVKALTLAARIMDEIGRAIDRNLFDCNDIQAIADLAVGKRAAFGNLICSADELIRIVKGEL